MNKRDREQLRASIAKDLVQGQGEHSPTEKQSYDFLLFFTRRRGAGAAAAGVLDGEMQRCRATLVPSEGISPVHEEGPNSGSATRPHCPVQGGDTAFVLRVRVRTRLNQELNGGILRLGVPRIRPRNPVHRVVERFGPTSVSCAI